jgi:hypothetical protein
MKFSNDIFLRTPDVVGVALGATVGLFATPDPEPETGCEPNLGVFFFTTGKAESAVVTDFWASSQPSTLSLSSIVVSKGELFSLSSKAAFETGMLGDLNMSWSWEREDDVVGVEPFLGEREDGPIVGRRGVCFVWMKD